MITLLARTFTIMTNKKMRLIAHGAIFLLIFLALLITIYFGRIKDRVQPFPFKCTSFVTYHFRNPSEKEFIISVAQDFEFENPANGYLSFSGIVNNQTQQWVIQRRIVFEHGSNVDKNTFLFNSHKILISSEDNVPEMYFKPLLREFSLDDSHVQLDVTNIERNMYLIGSPFSNIFNCVRY